MLRERIERLAAENKQEFAAEDFALFAEFKAALTRGAVRVIIEDAALIGGNCGVYEGAIVRAGAVLAPGTILTGATPVYDLVREEIYRRTEDAPLEIPAGAVVVPGARAVENKRGRAWGWSLYA